VMKDERVGEKALSSGARIMSFLRNLEPDVSQIGDVRGLGMMIGLELVKDRESKEHNPEMRDAIVKRSFERGLSLLPAGESVVRVAPPLIMSRPDVDTGLEIMRDSIRESAART
jgi:4-aminobutyrate aminotransferase